MPAEPAILRDVACELATDRLVLRRPREGDGRRVFEAVVETLDALRAWPASLPWALAKPSIAASEIYCRESLAAFTRRSALTYFAFDRTGTFVASTALHSIDWKVPAFELGYWCRSSRQRQGYTREALAALLRHAFDGLGARRVAVRTDEVNVASRRLCEAVGLELEGTLRNDRITSSGVLCSTCVYASIRDPR